MKHKRVAMGILLVLLLVVGVFPTASAMERTTYTIGVVPSFPPVPTYARWTPFIEELAKETGLDVRLKVYEKMVDFERDIISPTGPDFIFANALQIVVAHGAQAYHPQVRGSGKISVEVFVRRDSPVQSINDLVGKEIAFVGAKSL